MAIITHAEAVFSSSISIEFFFFFLLNAAASVALTCPDVIASICECEDLHNGIQLRCSNTDGNKTMNLLRVHQANLGLIQQLELRNASLHSIPSSFFSGLFIKKLDISHNQIVNINDDGFLGMSNILIELLIHHNNLTVLPVKALRPLTSLQRIDLSNNSIADIDEQNALPPLQKLYEISLSDNRICQIHKNAFDEVKYSLQTINLGRNCLRDVPAAAVRGFKQLMALHLHNNSITTLDALSFMNLPVMNLLNLASNQISNIHKQTFLNVPNLRYLYLSENRINDLRPGQFASFGQLEMLDLTGNQIYEIQENSFSNLQNLRQLYLGENRIGNIQPKGFTNSSIQILVLNSNHIKELKEGMFDGLAKLQQLALKDNQIRSIDQNTFYSNPSLAMIDLSENHLIDVPVSTFLAQLNLFLIDLSGNNLLRVPYGAFTRRVKTVLLKGNPLVCTERVHMLQQGVGIYVSSSYDDICEEKLSPTDIVTSNPQSESKNLTQSGTFVQDGSREQLKMQPIIRPLSEVQKTKSGENSDQTAERDELMIPVQPVNVPVNIPAHEYASSQWAPNGQIQSHQTTSNQPNEHQKPKNHDQSSGDEVRSSGHESMPNDENDRFSLNNPNIIHPFPVPFLKRPPKLSQSHIVANSEHRTTTTPVDISNLEPIEYANKPTLPPSIVVVDDALASNSGAKHSEHNQIEEIHTNWDEQHANELVISQNGSGERLERLAGPSMIILICLTTTIVVMAAVFIGLCIAKHRRMQILHGSLTSSATAARTTAYVAAQAAHLDMIYGTLQQNRNGQHLPERFDDAQAWMYAPVSYATNYYK